MVHVARVVSYLRYLHKDVLHHLTAVIVHTYVTGEGLPEENISVKHEDTSDHTHSSNRLTIKAGLWFYYPKFCGNVSISPSISVSAPLMVDGSVLMS